MEEGSVLTSNVPDVRIEDFQAFVAPDVRYDDQVKDFQVYRTEVIRRTGKLREWTESLVSTIVFVLIFTTFIAQATQVPTPSMVPTIMVGDHFFLDKIAFPGNFPASIRGWLPQRNIDRGDIIAFRPPPSANMTTPFVKRVIAIPGDSIEVKGRDVYLNGALIDEPYKIHVAQASLGSCDHCGPLTVPEDKFFVMGDNRDNSNDSRYWGFVDRESVIGKPLFVYWSFDSLSPYDSSERSWSSIAKGYISVAQHFFTRTRWFRFGTMVR
ncbi:MAG TPA: signal peptidase I [Terriglobia bacterium]|nr:signal peptidase I [Terriglobia bacterium]